MFTVECITVQTSKGKTVRVKVKVWIVDNYFGTACRIHTLSEMVTDWRELWYCSALCGH